MSKTRCVVGTVWGAWTVLSLVPDAKNPLANCRCACGTERLVQRGALVFGKSRSCGCLKSEHASKTRPTHGMSATRVYKVWTAMVARCSNPQEPSYRNYGARGIRVEWKGFDAFYADMGDPPAGAMIERLDTNGNYSRENCVWAGWEDQAANKRVSRRWLINGSEFRTSVEAAKALGIRPCQVNRRANGYARNGKFYPPWEGYSSVPLYGPDGRKYQASHDTIPQQSF